MGSPKYIWHLAVFIITSLWLTGCASNKYSTSISCIENKNRIDRFKVQNNHLANKYLNQVVRLFGKRVVTTTKNNSNQTMIATKGNIIYNRNYDNIRKGFYSCKTYQVKRGDTIFYIAWITGKDYKFLARINHIPQPYHLHVGQILQIFNDKTSSTSSIMLKNPLVVNSNNINSKSERIFIPNVKIQLNQPHFPLKKKNNYSKYSTRQDIKKSLFSSNKTVFVKKITGWTWPTDGTIIDQFSTEEGGNKGIDISGVRGQPILATTHGRVVYAGNALKGYGNLIIIKHNDHYLSAYAHNHKILVREQQKVRSGQKIATMGNTGSISIRLHFEIRYKGQSVNPLRYLPRR